MITPSDTQAAAIRDIVAWAAGGRHTPQVFYLAGYAGVGKSTVAATAIAELEARGVARRVVTGAFTGKAASVLRRKGVHNAMTIHSMIYSPLEDEKSNDGVSFVLAIDGPASNADLIVLDESSMIGDEMAADILSFEKKILVMGDPGQLPPVKGQGYFTRKKPDIFLTEIHRQAAESPIIRIATLARRGEPIPLGDYGSGVQVLKLTRENQPLIYRQSTQALCGVHRVRWVYTQRIRGLRGFEGPTPAKGEKVVCRKNSRPEGIFNGGSGVLIDEPWDIDNGLINLSVRMEDMTRDLRDLPTTPYLFAQHFSGPSERPRMKPWIHEFDWDYVRSVHSAQGSEWPDVTVVDDSRVFRADAEKHLYTAVTRASERLTLLLR